MLNVSMWALLWKACVSMEHVLLFISQKVQLLYPASFVKRAVFSKAGCDRMGSEHRWPNHIFFMHLDSDSTNLSASGLNPQNARSLRVLMQRKRNFMDSFALSMPDGYRCLQALLKSNRSNFTTPASYFCQLSNSLCAGA